MPKHQLKLPLALLVGCSAGTPPSGPCNSSADCSAGYICLFQHCTSPATITANLSAVVLPSDPSLAPQQYQPFQLNPTGVPHTSIAIVLHQPQQLTGQFVLPPGCDGDVASGKAFPVRMDFIGTSIIPGLPWRFSYQSDYQGKVSGVLPVFESFQRTISPSVPCTPPVLGRQRVLQAGPYDVGKNITFPAASESLRLLGTLTSASRSPADGGLIGTMVSVLPATPGSGQPLSIAVPVGPAATFDLQVPYAQAGSAPLASLTLSLQPQSARLSNYPSILMPFEGLIVDAGEPTAHLASIDGGPLVLTLPYDDSLKPVTISGSTSSPADGGAPLPEATVQISSTSLNGCVTDAGSCSYLQSVVSDQSGSFTFSSVPPGGYSITVIPEYPSSLLWFPTTVARDCTPLSDCTFLPLQVTQGVEVSGWVVRPNQEPFDDQGQAGIYSLPDMRLLTSTRLAPDGGFSLSAPPGREMLIVIPDEVTGYPSAYAPLGNVIVPQERLEVPLLPPGLLTGTVSVEAPDGGTSLPVPGATLLFYYVVSDPADPDGGEIAIPVTSGVTDSLGNFSVIGLPEAPPSQ